MRTADFDYHLPEELIAQRPLPDRGASRLLVLASGDGAPSHHSFAELPRLLPRGALLVFNDTRVIPARLRARRPTGGRVELLLVEPEPGHGDSAWRCLYSASKPLRPGDRLVLDRDSGATVFVLERYEGGQAACRFDVPGGLEANLERLGEVPLPPYIRRPDGEEPSDRERYQTIYARTEGAVAAPTAGLHFTAAMLDELDRAGFERRALTLHVGPGTFAPVKCEALTEHRMHEERYEIPAATAEAVSRASAAGRPIIAVGTTAVRALESAADEEGRVRAGAGRTALFIVPGYRFRVVSGMLTNFHLPRSTLIMLVAALAGRERVLAAYREAVARRYRFYSYGDAMLVLP